MTLQEAESKLTDLNNKIAELLSERESVIKEWNAAFNSENPENIICMVESVEDICYKFYLVNNVFKIQVCLLDGNDLKCSIEDLYKRIDTSMCIFNVANGREDIPEFQKNLVYAKAIEIRDSLTAN